MDAHRHADDARRLEWLRRLDLLGTGPDPEFDRLARIAAAVTGAAAAAVTFLAGGERWTRGRAGDGLLDGEAAAGLAEGFCGRLLEAGEPLEIADAARDPRFADHPGVRGPRAIGSCAGAPIAHEGLALGAVCVFDTRARALDDAQRAGLSDVAGLVEALLRSRREKHERLLWLATSDVVLMVDEDDRIQFCNPAVLQTFGWRPEELVGQPLALLQPERLRAGHAPSFARHLAAGDRRLDWRAAEVVARHRDGREFPVEISFSDLAVAGRRVFGAFMRDISQRVRQQQELRRSEERYRRIVQTAEEGIWMIDADAVTIFVNPKMARMLGYEIDDMLGRSLLDFMDEGVRQQAVDNVRRRKRGVAGQHDLRLRRKDGGDLWTAMSTSPAFDASGAYAGALAMVTDVTERRRAEEALRESEARFRALTALSSDWYWEQDADLRITQIAGGRDQDAALGLSRLVGHRPWDVIDQVDPAQAARERAIFEARAPFRDVEIAFRAPDGERHHVSISGEPVFAADGRFAGYRGVGRNITEQRRAQAVRQELEAQLRESQKMEAIGVLAGGIAHDFNNVLAGILGNVALAMQDLPPGDPLLAGLDQIRKASLRGRGLVQQILAFARRQPREVANCELGPLLAEGVGLLRATLPAGVTLEAALAPEPLHVMADATQLQQVLMNLCTNAWHALGGRPGRVAIVLDAVELDAAGARAIDAALPAGRYARLAVRDNGHGMSAATRARVFEPFFTTKPVGEGTGLGLAVAHGIVAAHGGAIRVESTEGVGSEFQVFLPRVEAARPPEHAPARPVAQRGRGERVLYIDDDDVMVVLVERLLQRAGYEVECTRNPAAAVAAVRAAPARFDVVVTDLNMPELSGLDVARALAAIRPDLPVVISSGNIPEQLQSDARRAGVRALLRKQYTLEELGAVVHWVLAGGQGLGLEPLQADLH